MGNRAGNLAVVAIAIIPIVMTLGNSMLVPVLPEMKKALELTSFQVSLTITVFSFAAALFIPIFGFVSDHMRRKWVIIPALILYGLGGLIAGIVSARSNGSFYLILTGRVLQGIGAAGTGPVAMALTGDLFKGAKQSRVLGIYEATNGSGKVFSPILGTLFALIAWYWVFLAFPAFCLVAILCMLFFIREEKEKKKGLSFKKYVRELGTVFRVEGRWLIVAYLTGMICLFTLFGVEFFLSNVLEDVYQIFSIKKGFILAIPISIMSIVSYITGRQIGKNKVRMKRLILFGLNLLTFSYLALIFFEQVIVFLSILCIGSIGTGLVLPCLNSFITGSVEEEKRGFVTALYGSVRFVGVALGPPIFSRLMEWSRTGMFVVAASIAFLAGICVLIFFRVKAMHKGGKEVDTLFKPLKMT